MPVDKGRSSVEKKLNLSFGKQISTDDKANEYLLRDVEDTLHDNFLQARNVEGNKQNLIIEEKGININMYRMFFIC